MWDNIFKLKSFHNSVVPFIVTVSLFAQNVIDGVTESLFAQNVTDGVTESLTCLHKMW